MKRTNVELRDEQLAQLRSLAARRGERGFSKLVQEAIDSFLAAEVLEQKRREEAIAMKGVLSEEQAARLRARIKKGRQQPWRSWPTRTS